MRQAFNRSRFVPLLLAVGLPLILAACSSVPLNEPKPIVRSEAKPTNKGLTKAPESPTVDWEPAPQGTGYYLDDGPGDLRPSNLADLPSAVPQVEPIAIPNTRPYTVMGQSFKPQTSLETPYVAEGKASWYGKKFHGARTANGEIYDMHQMTAAHPTLPLPSYARVTNLSNGKSVIVRVNDRGPFLRGREIDLSYAAAFQLDYINHGSALVRVEKLTPQAIAQFHSERQAPVANAGQAHPQAVALAPAAPAPVLSMRPLYLQVGAFGHRGNAEALLTDLSVKHETLGKAGQILTENGLHRVLLGPFATLDQANEAAIELAALVAIQPVIKQDLILP
jgi:rare lipoprotein A